MNNKTKISANALGAACVEDKDVEAFCVFVRGKGERVVKIAGDEMDLMGFAQTLRFYGECQLHQKWVGEDKAGDKSKSEKAKEKPCEPTT